MGFYQPAQLIIDARKHGVEVRPVDINHSQWDNTLEERTGKFCALRLGFRQARGLRQEDMEELIKHRKDGYTSIHTLREVGVLQSALEILADADAFRSVGLDRRQALWEVSVKDGPKALFPGQHAREAIEEKMTLPPMALSEHVVQDYAATSLSLKAHPVSFVRASLDQLRVTPLGSLVVAKDGDRVKVAGLVLVRQRPGTATGICFITLEDETGPGNLVVFQRLFDKYRKEIIQAKLLMVEGKVQREGEVIHVIVQRCFNISALLQGLVAPRETMELGPRSRADETTEPAGVTKDKQALIQGSIFPKGRNFH
jgi:error-prone DNA polymerase